MTEIRFDNRVALITGAGGGLGRTHALLLASRGAKVVVNDLGGNMDGTGGGHSMADTVVQEIQDAGGEAVANYDSVATPEGGQAMVQSALEAFGGLDIVINNAGILRDKTITKLSDEELTAVLDVHLRGAFHVTRPAFVHMKEQGYGRFVHTSSNSGLLGNFGQSNYGAAKMGLVGLSSVLALEGMKYNIKSNVLAPVAKSRMTESLLGPLVDSLDPALVSPLVAFLVSEDCPYTHSIFSAGGGRYAQMFVGLTQGWFAGKGNIPTPEEIQNNMGTITDQTGFVVPNSIADELQILGEMLKS